MFHPFHLPLLVEPQGEYVSLVVKHLTEGRLGKAANVVREGIGAVLHDPRGRLLGLYTAQARHIILS